MYKAIAWELGLPTERSRTTAYRAIREEITRLVGEAKQLPVLVIDEAQNLRNDAISSARATTDNSTSSQATTQSSESPVPTAPVRRRAQCLIFTTTTVTSAITAAPAHSHVRLSDDDGAM